MVDKFTLNVHSVMTATNEGSYNIEVTIVKASRWMAEWANNASHLLKHEKSQRALEEKKSKTRGKYQRHNARDIVTMTLLYKHIYKYYRTILLCINDSSETLRFTRCVCVKCGCAR